MTPPVLKPLRLEISALDTSPLPFDLTLAKQHLAVDTDDYNDLIETYILAAIAWAEGAAHRTIYARSHVWVLKEFPQAVDQSIRLPRGKTQSVESIQYIDSGGAEQTIYGPSSTESPADASWREDLRGDDGGVLLPLDGETWPDIDDEHPSPVAINFTAGWLTANIPADVTHAILFAVSDAYDTRGTGDLNTSGPHFMTRESLLSPYRLTRWY